MHLSIQQLALQHNFFIGFGFNISYEDKSKTKYHFSLLPFALETKSVSNGI